MAEQLKVKPKMYQVHALLSQLYERTGDLEKSLAHYKTFHGLRAQVEQDDNARKLADAKLVYEAEQTKKENVVIKAQKHEIESKNIQLQDTIDELTLATVSRKARGFTLLLAIVLFVLQNELMGWALGLLSSDNYFLSLGVKMAIVFSLIPINQAIERYLLKRVIKKRARPPLAQTTGMRSLR